MFWKSRITEDEYRSEVDRLCDLIAKSEETTKKHKDRCTALETENAALRAKLLNANELYLAEKSAREKQNGCVRGEYCNQCKHGVMVPRYADGAGLKCVCTYGTCPHFEKEG